MWRIDCKDKGKKETYEPGSSLVRDERVWTRVEAVELKRSR